MEASETDLEGGWDMRVYAYVSNECCSYIRAYAPGTFLERLGKPVHKDGDLWAWRDGKRATLKMIEDPAVIGWKHRAAVAVAKVLGWD